MVIVVDCVIIGISCHLYHNRHICECGYSCGWNIIVIAGIDGGVVTVQWCCVRAVVVPSERGKRSQEWVQCMYVIKSYGQW